MGKWVKLISLLAGVLMFTAFFRYTVEDKESWKSWNLPLSGKVIYLDPGHGGVDGGAGDEDGLEKDIALAVSEKIRDYLQEQGAIVLMTRERDVDLAARETKGYSVRKAEDLKKRLHLINESDADLYLSIHLNAIPSPRWRGAQTFFSPNQPENKEIAKSIQDEIVLNLENTDRLAKPIQHVYLLKYANKPGALVEIGFLSNPAEKRDLVTEEYQEMMAASIYKGILRYLDRTE